MMSGLSLPAQSARVRGSEMAKTYVGRLPAWEDERGIRHTMDLYSHAMDYGEEEIWRDCFTEDALFLVSDAQKNFDEIYRVQGGETLATYIATR